MGAVYRISGGDLVAKFDRNVYRLSAIKKAAYKYGGLFCVLIEESDRFTVVTLRPKAANDKPEESAGEFCNEVLDRELREEIAAETVGIRNLLLAHAFSKTSLIDAEMEISDYSAPNPLDGDRQSCENASLS